MTEAEAQAAENRFYAMNNKVESLSETELKEYCVLLSHSTHAMARDHVLNKSQLRIQIELIRSIRQFDKTSGRLAKVVLWLTVVAVVATLVQATFAVLSYYWPRQ